jgi:hypothetical protein
VDAPAPDVDGAGAQAFGDGEGEARGVQILIGLEDLFRHPVKCELQSRVGRRLLLQTCFASVIRLGTSVIKRLAASAVAVFAAAKTVDAEGMFILPALDTFLPRNPPNERVLDFKVDNFSEQKRRIEVYHYDDSYFDQF